MTKLTLVPSAEKPACPTRDQVRSIKTKLMRKNYASSVDWIADNDQPDDFNMQTIAALGTVELLAFVYRKTRRRVVLDVLEHRSLRCPTYAEQFS